MVGGGAKPPRASRPAVSNFEMVLLAGLHGVDDGDTFFGAVDGFLRLLGDALDRDDVSYVTHPLSIAQLYHSHGISIKSCHGARHAQKHVVLFPW
jgi:hypothetical protein